MTIETKVLRKKEFILNKKNLDLPKGIIIKSPANKIFLKLEKNKIKTTNFCNGEIEYDVLMEGPIVKPQRIIPTTKSIQKAKKAYEIGLSILEKGEYKINEYEPHFYLSSGLSSLRYLYAEELKDL